MLASIRSRWGPYAAPRIFGGRLSGRLPLTLVDLTWARYPQKSQMEAYSRARGDELPQ